jgi:lipoprotein NlpI
MRTTILGILIGGLLAAGLLASLTEETVTVLLRQAQEALKNRKADEALALADRAVAVDPKSAQAYFVRGVAHEMLDKHDRAVAEFSKTIELDPKAADAYQRRGSEHFKMGHITESIADFDHYLDLKPDQMPYHWQRGISYYYGGKYEDGRKQFEAHQKVNPNDVENAVWHYLCVARTSGVAKARASLLPIANDRRVPMMEVYALFGGKAKPEDVLATARAGKPSAKELKTRLFYAYLYLGLYYEAAGDGAKALDHLRKAARDYKNHGYMGDVAHVHVVLREAKNPSQEK